MAKKTFPEWYSELYELAKKYDLEWIIPEEEDYPTDAYDNGLTPDEALSDEISYIGASQ